MKDAMAFVCGNLDCSPIYSGGSNFQPDTVEAHSAWAINAWYQSHDWAVESCDFNKVAHLEPTVCGNR